MSIVASHAGVDYRLEVAHKKCGSCGAVSWEHADPFEARYQPLTQECFNMLAKYGPVEFQTRTGPGEPYYAFRWVPIKKGPTDATA